MISQKRLEGGLRQNKSTECTQSFVDTSHLCLKISKMPKNSKFRAAQMIKITVVGLQNDNNWFHVKSERQTNPENCVTYISLFFSTDYQHVLPEPVAEPNLETIGSTLHGTNASAPVKRIKLGLPKPQQTESVVPQNKPTEIPSNPTSTASIRDPRLRKPSGEKRLVVPNMENFHFEHESNPNVRIKKEIKMELKQERFWFFVGKKSQWAKSRQSSKKLCKTYFWNIVRNSKMIYVYREDF